MSSKTPLRWIVLPPSSDTPFWQDTLATAADKAGLNLDYAGSQTEATHLVLTEDAYLPFQMGAEAEDVVAIISQAGPLSDELAGLEPNVGRHQVVKYASEMTRRAYEKLPDRCISAKWFAKGPISLFPEFALHCPEAMVEPTSRRNYALVEAMQIYERDEAMWSSDVLDIYARDVDGNQTPRVLDVTGKPRFMAHGPYIFMPAGQWRVTYRLEFSRELVTKAFRLDWGEVETFSQFSFQPEKPGLYEVEMDWTWEAPAPCEMRLLVQEGIFDGILTLHDIKLTRLS